VDANRLQQVARKTLRTFVNILPIVVGMLLLTSLLVTLFPDAVSAGLFGGRAWSDALIGAALGSVAAGHPLASYVLGGELLAKGVSLVAVTALLVSWVTVGLVQLPAEALMLGRRFALVRNGLCFLFAVAVAWLTVLSLSLLGAGVGA